MVKIGDDLEYIGEHEHLTPTGWSSAGQELVPGGRYTCSYVEVDESAKCPACGDSVWVSVTGINDGGEWTSCEFRPVAKRSDTLAIESFLVIKPGFEEPRRVVEPVRRKEGVK